MNQPLGPTTNTPNNASNIVEVSAQNFQEVIERSKEVPVLLEFYAEGAEQSQPTTVILNKLVTEYAGKFVLGRVDVQQNPEVAQQLQVRGLPTVKVVYQGQLAQDLEGPQEESKFREVLDQLTMSPVERIREQITLLLMQGDRGGAIQLLQQVIAQEPGNHALQAELADLLIMDERVDEARQILASLPADAEGINKPKKRLEFIDKAAELPTMDNLQADLAASPDAPAAIYPVAIRLVVDDQIEAALDHLLLMLQKDREYEDELARRTMIDVFDLLGKGDAVATAYRRKMFAFLH